MSERLRTEALGLLCCQSLESSRLHNTTSVDCSLDPSGPISSPSAAGSHIRRASAQISASRCSSTCALIANPISSAVAVEGCFVVRTQMLVKVKIFENNVT